MGSPCRQCGSTVTYDVPMEAFARESADPSFACGATAGALALSPSRIATLARALAAGAEPPRMLVCKDCGYWELR